jgi:hypothetical protein
MISIYHSIRFTSIRMTVQSVLFYPTPDEVTELTNSWIVLMGTGGLRLCRESTNGNAEEVSAGSAEPTSSCGAGGLPWQWRVFRASAEGLSIPP